MRRTLAMVITSSDCSKIILHWRSVAKIQRARETKSQAIVIK